MVGALDRGQRRFPPLGVPLAVLYKFWDDQGNYLAAIITYYAFIAIFPLLLLASSIFGFVLQGNPELQDRVLNSALSSFPIIGDQLGRPEGLQGSTVGVVVGTLAALYGALGLGQAIQNAMNIAWSVPRNSRPNLIYTRVRSLGLLVTAGLAVLAVSVISALGSTTEVFGPRVNGTLKVIITLVTVLLIASVLTLLFRLAAARDHSLRTAIPGALTTAVLWQLLQYAGTKYATSVLSGTDNGTLNATFGLVLGLIGLIYIASTVAVLGIEINVVLVRHLWPRALMTLFTDNVDLTDADRRAYASYAHMQRHKGFESVEVVFEQRNGETHEFALDLGDQRRTSQRPGPAGTVTGDPQVEPPSEPADRP